MNQPPKNRHRIAAALCAIVASASLGMGAVAVAKSSDSRVTAAITAWRTQ